MILSTDDINYPFTKLLNTRINKSNISISPLLLLAKEYKIEPVISICTCIGFFITFCEVFSMLSILFRYTAIIFCCNYVYSKLLNIKNRGLIFYIPLALITLFTTVISHILSTKYGFIVTPLQILLLYIYFYITGFESVKETFTTTLLAYSICYICFLTAAFCATIPVTLIAAYLINVDSLPFTFLQFWVSSLQCALCYLLFRIKRFRKGIPFLHNPFATKIGVFLGILFLCCNMVIFTDISETQTESDFFFLLAILFSFILLVLFFIWWQNELHHSYLLQVKTHECDMLEKQLTYYQEKMEMLENDNTKLSKLVHRDNKLIPSMQLGVRDFLSCALEGNTENLSRQGAALLHQLDMEISERSTMLTTFSHGQNKLPHTDILSIDQLLSYFLQRCDNDKITFDCSFLGDFSSIIEQTLSEKELSTLLADLLENALIATKHNDGKYIMLHMGILNNYFFVEVWDSGQLFPKEVLYHWGKKKYTTHKTQGGSGIGMMVIYELLQKYHASFVIDETVPKENFCTKKITVTFDGESRYHLYSKRSPEELTYLSKRGDLKIVSDISEK